MCDPLCEFRVLSHYKDICDVLICFGIFWYFDVFWYFDRLLSLSPRPLSDDHCDVVYGFVHVIWSIFGVFYTVLSYSPCDKIGYFCVTILRREVAMMNHDKS